MFLLAFVVGLLFGSCHGRDKLFWPGVGAEPYLTHVGAPGTQHNRERNDTNFYTTNADIPNPPALRGFTGEHGSYNFLRIYHQTLVLIGEAKHGLWRFQESGFIREYRRFRHLGLLYFMNPDHHLPEFWANVLRINYASYWPNEGHEGYRYPDNPYWQIFINYIDLSIYHPKYNGKYENHVAIDLPVFCTHLSQDEYPYAYKLWKYAVLQPRANKFGPLGLRAGLDVTHNYLNVLRMELFPDASIWANVGVWSGTDFMRTTLDDIVNSTAQTVNYQRVDLSSMDYEIYIVERPMMNIPTLFVALVMTDKNDTLYMSYVRPEAGNLYWEGLVARNKTNVGNVHLPYPVLWVLNPTPQIQPIFGLPVFGHLEYNRTKFGLTGGACPQMGGDFARYPYGRPGAGFASNYQEITPICDAVLIDFKAWTNLDIDWNDPTLSLGNAPCDTDTRNYTMDRNVYGNYTDSYLVSLGAQNPYFADLTDDGKVIEYDEEPKPERVTVPLNFTHNGRWLHYLAIPDVSNEPDLFDVSFDP